MWTHVLGIPCCQKSSANGFGRRRGDREVGARLENMVQSGKSNQGRPQTSGALPGGRTGGYESSSRDRVVYLTTCLIGHPVEVHVKNGSSYTGIFHATDAEKDFGIILKMARLIKDGTLQGDRAIMEFVSKAPSKIFIIPDEELVQVMAKPVTRDGFASELQHEKHQEILIDSAISQSPQHEGERVLAPWVPREDDPQCPELENIFDSPWIRNWDQFETNQKLFGVKSTFNEELYTTKLERGPHMREFEREAMRIAREIEGEETQDLHLAEERGFDLHDNFDIDEEMRFSSVLRGRGFDDSGYEEEEDIMLDSHNIETFGDSSDSHSRRPADLTSLQGSVGVRIPSSSSLVDNIPPSLATINLNRSGFNDQARWLASELPSKSFPVSDSESRIQDDLLGEHRGSSDAKEFAEKQSTYSHSLLDDKIDASDKAGHGPASSKVIGETHSANSHGQPGSCASSNSDCVAAVSASSGSGLSPSSSMGSLSSKKSTLNPHAKEFKLNPNAKSFTPSQTAARPSTPVSDGSFCYQPQMSPVPHMYMPVSFGIGPSFPGHQPVIFSQQVAPTQSSQPYFHPNGPQYGQQTLLGQRQVVYYQPEMQYKEGRRH
ncbi:hypothetical protein ES332_A10G060700v1 [Gossypium tomentosum]|uniref:LsmAD domain-containing protein n=1 Tax=Gossypium tomentosum TaxID=34277 RepID=A0A5D2NNX7_GOSTO|nr:hypothetical protein ES332_A10G060700v1 [Gossypium tomentosum]